MNSCVGGASEPNAGAAASGAGGGAAAGAGVSGAGAAAGAGVSGAGGAAAGAGGCGTACGAGTWGALAAAGVESGAAPGAGASASPGAGPTTWAGSIPVGKCGSVPGTTPTAGSWIAGFAADGRPPGESGVVATGLDATVGAGGSSWLRSPGMLSLFGSLIVSPSVGAPGADGCCTNWFTDDATCLESAGAAEFPANADAAAISIEAAPCGLAAAC